MGGEDPIQAGAARPGPRLHRRGDRTGVGDSGASAMHGAVGESYRNWDPRARSDRLLGALWPGMPTQRGATSIASAWPTRRGRCTTILPTSRRGPAPGARRRRRCCTVNKGLTGFRKGAMKHLRTCTTGMLRARFDSGTPEKLPAIRRRFRQPSVSTNRSRPPFHETRQMPDRLLVHQTESPHPSART